MLNAKFLRNKVERQIELNGSKYTVKRYDVDEFNQKEDNPKDKKVINGIFHEMISNVKSLSEMDGARIITVPRSFILCLFEDGNDIFLDDEIVINEQIYKVIDKNNIGNFNVAYDIILEHIKDESNT